MTGRYDAYERRAAARLQRHNPRWLITWGAWSRKFYAFPAFDAPPGTIVTATSPARLLPRLRETEARAARTTPPGPAGPDATKGHS